jgi:hypothetical protein
MSHVHRLPLGFDYRSAEWSYRSGLAGLTAMDSCGTAFVPRSACRREQRTYRASSIPSLYWYGDEVARIVGF